MGKDFISGGYPRLCAGTFFTLLCEAKKTGDEKLSNKDVFIGLVRATLKSDYQPDVAEKTLDRYVTAFRSCESSKAGKLSLAMTENQHKEPLEAFDEGVRNDYRQRLGLMGEFTQLYIETDQLLKLDITLIGRLLNLIEKDDTIQEDDEFYVCPDGSAATKADIRKMRTVCFESFLIGVRHYALTKRNHAAGKETFNKWCPEGKVTGQERVFKKDIFKPVDREYEVEHRLGQAVKKPVKNNPVDVQDEEPGQADLPAGYDGYLKSAGNKYGTIKTLLYKDEPHPFYDFYVCNNVAWNEAAPGNTGLRQKVEEGLNYRKLSAISKYTILCGTGGLGKSMMLRHILLDAVSNFDTYGRIPVIVQLRNYNEDYSDISGFVLSDISGLWGSLDKEGLLSMLKAGRLLLLFDGLDGIKSECLEKFTNQLTAFVDRYPDNTVVISSRPYSHFTSFHYFTIVRLLPLTKEQSGQLIERLDLKADSKMVKEQFTGQLKDGLYEDRKGLSDNPLLLTIMFMTFNTFGDVSGQKHVFYENMYQVLAKGNDSFNKESFRRSFSMKCSVNDFADYFSFFCAVTYNDGIISFTHGKMDLYFRRLKNHYKLEDVDVDDFIYDLTSNLCLMYNENDEYSFIHRSFQEYFCARYFSYQKDENLRRTIAIFDRHDPTKKEDIVLPMLYEMIPDRLKEFVFIPYLESLIRKCDEGDGIWTFLPTIYKNLECSEGDLSGEEDNFPESNLYAYIAESFGFGLGSMDYSLFPGITLFPGIIHVYREDEGRIDYEYNLSMDYLETYGPAEETGHIYVFPWNVIIRQKDSMIYLKEAIEDPDKPLMKEYQAMRNLLPKLKGEMTRTGDDIFDFMD